MKKTLALAFAAALAVQAAPAETWVSVCTVKDLQYNQTIGGKGTLLIGQGDGTYQSIKLTQTFFDQVAVCGTPDTGQPAPVIPATQICANRSRDSIYLLTRNAKGPPGAQETPYCEATITIVDDAPAH